MYIHWDRKYETGQLLIDTEHRLLVMLFRKLDVAIKSHLSDELLKPILLEVKKFVEFHFISEENVMRETGYPAIDAHRKLHHELLLELNSMIAALPSRREYPEDLLYFLSQWLIDHIAEHDQGVARHVAEAAARPVGELVYTEYLLSHAASAGGG